MLKLVARRSGHFFLETELLPWRLIGRMLLRVGFAMESSDDEKDGAPGNYIPKELTHGVASNGAKFVDEVLNEVEQPVMHIDTQALDIGIETEQLEISSQLRDSIATEMWNDYIRDLSAM
ncbi:hypothetical protein CFP56_018112 [Quercus suber]|uniref:Uncharacterized protein n=1 Tax=Quercus suber TaxID=58331 RepID=A0AAW0KLQ6_QUESU